MANYSKIIPLPSLIWSSDGILFSISDMFLCLIRITLPRQGSCVLPRQGSSNEICSHVFQTKVRKVITEYQ